MEHRRGRWRAAGAALMLWPLPAIAQSESAGEALSAAASAPAEPVQHQTLLGDFGGARQALEEHGIALGLSEVGEVLGNLTGGTHRGFEYAGLTTLSLTLDTDKAFHWQGGTFYASALQIHGRNLNADNLAALQAISSIDAQRTSRLWELWLQQHLPDGRSDVRIGQQSLDQEFLVNPDGAVFINAMMGFPVLPSTDLYGGAPVYPLSSLGIRLRTKPDEALTLLAGVFDDNPPGGPFFDDAQLRGAEASGTRFNLGTGALFIGEIQYADPRADLPGTYKLGAWIDTGRFPDQRFDIAGLSLADPASRSVARLHKNNFSVYGIVDQTIWREADGPRSLAVIARVMGAPSDRNLIDWSFNAGVTLKSPLPGRKDDSVGLAYGWAHVSGRAAGLDRDTALFNRLGSPIRSSEQVIEITYQYQAAPWWLVQPDLQYVIRPGGGLPLPTAPTRRIGDELVVGLRTTVTF